MAQLTKEVRDDLKARLYQMREDLENKPLDDGELLHGVHMECQLEHAFYLTACNTLVDPSEFKPNSGKPKCPTCWEPDVICPVCKEVMD